MSDLVLNPEDRFFHIEAQIKNTIDKHIKKDFTWIRIFCTPDSEILRKPIGDISLSGLGRDWTLRRYILHLNDI